MQREYRRPAPPPIENQALVELGRDLFFDPQLSASGKTACASCHFPELGWGMTGPRGRNDSGNLTSRASQPLVDRREAERLDVLRALERGEVDIETASHRLEILEESLAAASA